LGLFLLSWPGQKTALANLPHPGKSPQFTPLSCTQTAPGEGEMGTYNLTATTVIPA
jgi:hypothetical protein